MLTYKHVHRYLCVYICKYICMYVHTYVYMCVYVYRCMSIHVYIYIQGIDIIIGAKYFLFEALDPRGASGDKDLEF